MKISLEGVIGPNSLIRFTKQKEFEKGLDQIGNLLEKCESFSEIFELVKRVVKKVLNKHRIGLMLVLADLPISVGAFHTIGSNSIVMNRRILRLFEGSETRRIKNYIFIILLHEYLHTLGYTNETEVRALSYEVVFEAFGPEHPLTQMAERGPLSTIPRSIPARISGLEEAPQLIKKFERSNDKYIQ